MINRREALIAAAAVALAPRLPEAAPAAKIIRDQAFEGDVHHHPGWVFVNCEFREGTLYIHNPTDEPIAVDCRFVGMREPFVEIVKD